MDKLEQKIQKRKSISRMILKLKRNIGMSVNIAVVDPAQKQNEIK